MRTLRPEGVVTRGTTGINRLRRSDRWAVHHSGIARVLRSAPDPLVVDLGYGAMPVTTLELASRLCTACHIVGSERAGSDAAPPFAAIARAPDVTLSELHGWGGPGHPVLPNLVLTRKQITDINAYLDSLRGVEKAPRPGSERPPLGSESTARS